MPLSGGRSFAEGLKSILGNLAQLGALPDADMNVISQLQQAIVAVIRAGSPGDQAAMAARGAGGPPPGAGAPPGAGGPPGGAPPMGPPSPPAAGGMAGPGAPMGGLAPNPGNMDEIRRMLTAGRPG
jgi:hypothetical protein